MYLQMSIIMGIGSGLLEIFFCRAIPPLHALIKKNQALDITFSFLVAYLLSGQQFGPTMVIGGVIANLMTTCWWRVEDSVIHTYRVVNTKKKQGVQFVKDSVDFVIKVFRLVTWPYRAGRAVRTQYQTLRRAA